MDSRNKGVEVDRKTLLSALWLFVLFNMIYADIITMLTPGWLERVDAYSQLFDWRVLVGFSVLLEIPIAMTFLSHVLSDRANRWVHSVAVPVTVSFVVLGGSTYPHYLFFATVEIVAMLLTVWLVWQEMPRSAFRISVTQR